MRGSAASTSVASGKEQAMPSRVGKKPIPIPSGVTVARDGQAGLDAAQNIYHEELPG